VADKKIVEPSKDRADTGVLSLLETQITNGTPFGTEHEPNWGIF